LLNFLCLIFELPVRGTAAKILNVIHSFARLLFIGIPMCKQVIYDFLHRIKQVSVVRVKRPLLDFSRNFVVAAAKSV